MDSLINVGNEDAPQICLSLDSVSTNDGPDANPPEVNFPDVSSRISNNARITSSKGDGGTGRETNNTNNTDTSGISNISKEVDKVNLNEDSHSSSSNLRRKNPNMLIIGSININFLAEKFESLKNLIKDKLDILVLQETKIDCTYPNAQFQIEGFEQPFRLDRTKNWGGVMIYIKDNLLYKKVTSIRNRMILKVFFSNWT